SFFYSQRRAPNCSSAHFFSPFLMGNQCVAPAYLSCDYLPRFSRPFLLSVIQRGSMTTAGRLKNIVEAEGMHWGASAADYHQTATAHMEGQWQIFIGPVLVKYPVDYSATIDFAAGYGRNTAKLLSLGVKAVTAVDVNADCIAALRTKFAEDRRVTV